VLDEHDAVHKEADQGLLTVDSAVQVEEPEVGGRDRRHHAEPGDADGFPAAPRWPGSVLYTHEYRVDRVDRVDRVAGAARRSA